MKVGDIVSESLDKRMDWEEAERHDRTQSGVVFQKNGDIYHILWFDTQESSSRMQAWAQSDSVRILNESR